MFLLMDNINQPQYQHRGTIISVTTHIIYQGDVSFGKKGGKK
jgi:hypothetical protein